MFLDVSTDYYISWVTRHNDVNSFTYYDRLEGHFGYLEFNVEMMDKENNMEQRYTHIYKFNNQYVEFLMNAWKDLYGTLDTVLLEDLKEDLPTCVIQAKGKAAKSIRSFTSLRSVR